MPNDFEHNFFSVIVSYDDGHVDWTNDAQFNIGQLDLLKEYVDEALEDEECNEVDICAYDYTVAAYRVIWCTGVRS